MNDFEKYIKEHQRKFDLEDINPQIWEKIEAGVKPKRFRLNARKKGILALIAAILISFFCYKWFENQQKLSITSQLLAEYGFEDANVTDVLDTKIHDIQKALVPVSFKSDLEILVGQVKYIDQYYLEKIENLHLKQNETELNKEVLLYYKAKSEILDRVLNEIDKINNNEKTYQVTSEKTSLSI